MSFVARKRVFLATRYRGPGFQVDGIGRVRTLPELGLALNANPALNVVMLGDYDAEPDGVFAASPLGTTAATTYRGDFDGRGRRLGGLRLVDNDPTPGLEDGLFGNVGDNSGAGRVHDLIASVDIRQLHWERTTRDSAGRYLLGTTVGGVVASLRGTLERVTVNGRIYGSGSGGQFGGLVGRNEMWPSKAIASVTRGNPTIVQTVLPHGIPSGQRACVANAGGMPALNSRQGNVSRLYTVTSLGASTLSIDIDSSGFPAYTSGGVIMGAGTVSNCKTNARVEVSPYNYNSYFSILVASNRGLLEYCQDSRRAQSVIPRTTVPNPPTAAYTAGWTGKASITGDVLNVTETSLGAMAVGLDIFAPNTVPGAVVASGTRVTADLGGGNWRVSIAQPVAVSSRDLLAASGAPGTYLATGQWAANIAGDNGLPAVGDSPTAVVRYNKSYADLRNADNVNSANLTGAIVAYQGDGIAYGNEAYGRIEGASSVSGGIGFNALSSSAHYANLSACDVIALAGNAGGNAGQDYGASNDNIAAGNVRGTTAVGTSIGLLRGTGTLVRVLAFGSATGTVGVGSLVGQALTGASLDESLCFGVATGTSKVGAIGNRGTGVTITKVVFDIDSTGSAIGVGSGESTGVSGLSDSTILAGLPSGFDPTKWSRGVITPNYPVPTAAPVPPNPTVNLNPPPSLAVVGHATSFDSTTLTLPTDIKAGDYAIVWNFAQNTATTAPSLVATTPTLSIQQFSTATHGCRITQYVKQLDGTETTISGMTTGTRGRLMGALIVRGSKATLSSTWTRLNARVAIDGAAGGNAVQSMGAGTSPCIVVGCAIYDAGQPPANQISLGDDEVIEVTSAITPSLMMRISYRIKNTGAAASTFTGDTDAGGVAVTCVNVSYAP